MSSCSSPARPSFHGNRHKFLPDDHCNIPQSDAIDLVPRLDPPQWCCVQGVSVMVATHGDDVANTCHLTTEAGVIGGSPVGGLLFGAARNATALMPAASIIDFYQGGGCDLAVLGMAEVRSKHQDLS